MSDNVQHMDTKDEIHKDDCRISASFEDNRDPITFAHVGGMYDLKEIARMKIITPFLQPELFKKYGKDAGGGILLYGPPGCGKTYFARAIAGECEASFFNVGIHDILDMYVGNSEKNVHALFEEARAHVPAVLFIDEMDALGRKRELLRYSCLSTTINSFLSEMDGVGGCNKNLLVIGATNVPWDIDGAFKRPGRFDTLFLVPPPDKTGREEILRAGLASRPIGKIDYTLLAKKTKLFSGADLAGMIERATEIVIDEVLQTGVERNIEMDDLLSALKVTRPSVGPWLETARNYTEYANSDGQYNDIKQLVSQTKTKDKNKFGFL